MIVFAGLVPHGPSLVPSIAGEKIKQVKKTIEALKGLEERLYLAHPDTIIVLSPHGKAIPNTVSVYVDETHECRLRDVGDYGTSFTCQPDMELIDHLRHHIIRAGANMTLKTVPDLDYGIVVPLLYLAKHLKKAKIIAINSHLSGLKENYHFGKLLKEELAKTNRRVAVIASTDLAHSALTYSSEKAAHFDAALVDLIANNNVAGLLGLEGHELELARPCGLPLLLLLLGILDGMAYTPQNYSYEAPFGVGYLVSNFKLP